MEITASCFDAGPPPACPAPFNMAAHVLAEAGRLSEKIALQIVRPQGAERWSFGKLEAAVRGTGTGLLALGLAPGSRILLRLGNTVDFPIAYLGAIAVGLVPVPTSAQLTEAEVTKIAQDLQPSLILAAPGIARPGDPTCPVMDLAALKALRDSPPCDWEMGDPDRLAYMVFTSGTSGQPRAVMHAHRAIWARGMMQAGWTGLSEGDRLMHAGAFNWTYTLGTGLMDPWVVGASALIPAEGVTPAQLPLLMKRFDATIFAAAPGVFRQILRGPLPSLPKLRHGLSAGEKLPQALREAWSQATGTPVLEAYGMSECSTFISAPPGRALPEGATGWPQPGRAVALLGEDGLPVPLGAPGTIAVNRRDPGLFLGYFGAPQETESRMQGAWFLTGDTGCMEPSGAITYLGRADDMLNAGGYRVSPLEIEQAMNACPGIDESAAVELEVRPGVSVIGLFHSGAALPEAELAAFAQARLARYKCPRLYFHLPVLPKNANNKLARKALRLGWTPPQGGTS